jgi:hypothetical protein
MSSERHDLQKDVGTSHGPPEGGALDHHVLSASPMDGAGGGQSRPAPPLTLEASGDREANGQSKQLAAPPNQQVDSKLMAAFVSEAGIQVSPVQDDALLTKVCGWQGGGIYPGVDNWETVEMPAETRLLGGLPGQSEYYTIERSLQDVDLNRQAYWESLQVKAHETFGYRPKVGVYVLTSSSHAAIAKTTANPQYGQGGAWQVFIDDFKTKLECIEEVVLT